IRMTRPRANHRLTNRQQRRRPKLATERSNLLASCRDGCPEAIMLAHGFTIADMVDLVCDGLATASAERVVAGSVVNEVGSVAARRGNGTIRPSGHRLRRIVASSRCPSSRAVAFAMIARTRARTLRVTNASGSARTGIGVMLGT